MQERQHSGTSTTICISITKYIFPVHNQNKQNSNSVLRIFFSKPRFDTVGRRETDYQRYNGHPKPFIRARKVRQTGVRVLEQADCAEFPKYIYHRYMPCFQIMMRPPCSTVEENVQGWGFGGFLQWVWFFFFQHCCNIVSLQLIFNFAVVEFTVHHVPNHQKKKKSGKSHSRLQFNCFG